MDTNWALSLCGIRALATASISIMGLTVSRDRNSGSYRNRRTRPSHRVDRVQGHGQEEDKAQPQR